MNIRKPCDCWIRIFSFPKAGFYLIDLSSVVQFIKGSVIYFVANTSHGNLIKLNHHEK